MKCELNTGSHWDPANEVMIDWDKRHFCENDASHEYHTVIASELNPTKKAPIVICLCAKHSETFKLFVGHLKEIS